MKKALLYLFVFIAVQFFATWLVYAVWLLITGCAPAELAAMFKGDKSLVQNVPMMITASAVCSVILLLLFLRFKWAVLSPAYLRMRRWGVFLWCVVAAVGTIIPSVWLSEQLPALPDTMQETFKAIIGSEYGYFMLCLLAPFVEEVVFRGAILRALLGSIKNRWACIAISAAVFALVHANPAQMPHALLMGILLGWLYCRTGSILPGVAVHWVNNTVTFVVCRLFPQMSDTTLTEFFGGDHKRVVLSVVFSLFILLPAIYQLNVKTSKMRGMKNEE